MLFKRELRRNLKSFLVVSLICAALVMYVISIAPSFGQDIQQILDIKLPKQFQSAFGMKNLDFGTPMGFYALMFSYVYLFISIYAAGLFAGIMLKEYSDKTAEYLFSHPVKRIIIIRTKLLASLFYLVIAVILIFLISLLSFSIFIQDDYSISPMILMSLSWLMGAMTFGSMAFLISSFLNKTRSSSGIATGLVIVFYMLQVVISLNKDLENLQYLSPFDWFKGNDIASSGEISTEYVIISFVVTSVCFVFGTIRFRKKDVLI